MRKDFYRLCLGVEHVYTFVHISLAELHDFTTPLTTWVTLGNLFTISVPQVPHA